MKLFRINNNVEVVSASLTECILVLVGIFFVRKLTTLTNILHAGKRESVSQQNIYEHRRTQTLRSGNAELYAR